MDTIKAVVFDVDDTLYEQAAPFGRAYEAVFHNRYRLDIRELFRLNRIRSDEVFLPWQEGKMTFQDMVIYRAKNSFQDMGISITDEEAKKFQEAYEYEQKHLQMTPYMHQLLEKCKKTKKLAIISNGESMHQWEKIRQLGVLKWIDEKNVFVSGDTQFIKPDKRAFFHAAKQLKAEPKNCLYVGDNYENDVIGAKKAGWNVIWMNRYEIAAPNDKIKPDAICYNEQQLADYVL